MVKYALLVGINYKGTINMLRGPIQDVKDIRQLILTWGFKPENITFMTDDEKGINYPSAYNIAFQLNSLCTKMKAGDQAIFYYSGHGTRIRDTSENHEEKSGLDSCIVPIDFRQAGVIADDLIKRLLDKIPSGANLFSVFDSCNSGTVCDLKYNLYDTSYRKDITLKIRGFDYTNWVKRQFVSVDTKQQDTTADIITLTACRDDQVAYDGVSQGGGIGRNGALTSSFLSCMKKYSQRNIPTLQLEHILQNVRGGIVAMRLSQVPQLMTGKPYDMNTLFKDFLKI